MRADQIENAVHFDISQDDDVSPDVIFSGSVGLILSTGITQQVFDTLSTALKCIHYMDSNKQVLVIYN